MTQEPVALMRKTDITEFCEYNMEMAKNDNPNSFAKWIPLYTHPAELTDEEILEIIKQQDWFSMSWVDMVRRIESKIRNG